MEPKFVLWIPRDDEGVDFSYCAVTDEEDLLKAIAGISVSMLDRIVLTSPPLKFSLVVAP